jgi:hypothetical protein
MTEEQKVPPGIIAFKNHGGYIKTLRDAEIYHERVIEYDEWVKSKLFNPYHAPYDIQTISVDGKEWSVWDHTDKGTIISFKWEDQWRAETKRVHYSTFHLVSQLSKLPPNPSLNNEEGEILNQWISKHGRDLRFINSDLWQKSHDALKANRRETIYGFQNEPPLSESEYKIGEIKYQTLTIPSDGKEYWINGILMPPGVYKLSPQYQGPSTT